MSDKAIRPGLAFDVEHAAGRVRQHFLDSIATKQRVIDFCTPKIVEVAQCIASAFGNGHKLLLCGNGGSAGDAQHIAAEFVSLLRLDYLRPGLPAIALTTDTSILTASANDFGFDGVFARQVQALGRPGDVLVGITTSGNSKNILAAFEQAKQNGIVTVALTGRDGGKVHTMADISICVASTVTQHIQESHIAIGHVLCELVECAVFPNPKG